VHPSQLAAAAAPAGGAALDQVLIPSLGAAVVVAALVAVGARRRSGRSYAWLDRAEALASARSGGLPGWAALPLALGGLSLLAAVFGLQWDVALHADRGRDTGPLANPSHYFILLGLLGAFAAGWLAVVLPQARPGPAAVRISADWHAPAGGLAMMATSGFALAGFPLDDVWHRLFGQDVTLWGPTHLMMLAGAALTLVGMGVLLVEGARAAGTAPRRPDLVLLCGGLLLGLSIFQDEFDHGIPQFRLLFHPLLIAAAAGAALVAARLLAGRGGALGAVVLFLLARAALALLVGPVLGETAARFPLYVAEALLVEGAALAVGTARAGRFAVVAGVLAGTLGVAAELAWSHAWMPLAWPAHLLPGAVAVGAVGGVGGAVLGAFLAGALRLRRDEARVLPAAVAALAVAGAGLALLPTSVPDVRAAVDLRPAGPGRVHATVRVDPPGALEGADWLRTVAWQGGGVEGAPLRRTGPGRYATTEPLPVGGSWKTAIRFHRGRELAILPVFLPADPAIAGADEVPALPRFIRAFVADRDVLQRERRDGIPPALWTAAVAAVLALIAALVAGLGAALARLARLGDGVPGRAPGAVV